jgi:septum formation protein
VAQEPGKSVVGGPQLVLASRSPRRQDAMRALGLAFDVAVSHVELTLPAGDDPCDPVPIAVAKVVDIARTSSATAIVLGADTIVVDGTTPLGKPNDKDEAVAMLMGLRGRTHAVRTGVALAVDGRLTTLEVSAPVRMRNFDLETAMAYVATGESLDCAGSYDARGHAGATLLRPVEGCLSAVVGFPMTAISRLLGEVAGVTKVHDEVAACEVLCNAPCLARDGSTAHVCAGVHVRQSSVWNS